MFDIDFPPATTQSKLAACPTEKIPQTTDWIYQDFFNTVLAGDHATFTSLPTLPTLFPHENSCLPYYKEHLLEQQHSLFKNLRQGDDKQSMFSISSAEDEESGSELESDSNASYKTTSSSIASTYNNSDDAAILADMVPPVLIESTISTQASESTFSLSSTSTKEDDDKHASTIKSTTFTTPNRDDLLCAPLSKRKSTSSLHSLKSIMSDVFHTNKKTKLSHHPHHQSSPPSPTSSSMNEFYVPEKKSTTSMAKTMSRKLFKYLKHHRHA